MINWNILESQINQAFAEIVDQFKEEQIEQLTEEKWAWPRETKRQNGDTVTSPRDIVDSGALLNSLEVEEMSTTEVIYSYPVEYAIFVHEGAILHNGTQLPARPWVDEAAKELKSKLL